MIGARRERAPLARNGGVDDAEDEGAGPACAVALAFEGGELVGCGVGCWLRCADVKEAGLGPGGGRGGGGGSRVGGGLGSRVGCEVRGGAVREVGHRPACEVGHRAARGRGGVLAELDGVAVNQIGQEHERAGEGALGEFGESPLEVGERGGGVRDESGLGGGGRVEGGLDEYGRGGVRRQCWLRRFVARDGCEQCVGSGRRRVGRRADEIGGGE